MSNTYIEKLILILNTFNINVHNIVNENVEKQEAIFVKNNDLIDNLNKVRE